jgi:hypothetical protein
MKNIPSQIVTFAASYQIVNIEAAWKFISPKQLGCVVPEQAVCADWL